MLLEVGNVATRVTQASDEELAWLVDFLSPDDAKANFRHGGDGKVHLFHALTRSFPSGFLPLVRKEAAAKGIALQEADRRTAPPVDPSVDLTWLRDYQREAVEACLRKSRGIVKVPTGGGKTEIAAALGRAVPCRWLFVVHRADLVRQSAERFELRTGERAGVAGDGVFQPARFTAATFQTLYHGLRSPVIKQLLESVEGLIVDEAHTLPAATFYRVAQACKNAYYRIGLSGTPLARDDDRSAWTIAATGPIIYRIAAEKLISAGVLSRPRIRFLPVHQTSDGCRWNDVYGECIVRSTTRNRVVVDAIRRAAKPALVFVKEIAHGRILRDAARKLGLRVAFVWGALSTEHRRKFVDELVAGEHDAIICSVVFQEGIDIPALRSVVVASGGRSLIATLQRIGRGMRVADGKAEFEVWDVLDKGHKWLDHHSRKRLAAYVGEGYQTTLEDSGQLSLLPSVPAQKKRKRMTEMERFDKIEAAAFEGDGWHSQFGRRVSQ